MQDSETGEISEDWTKDSWKLPKWNSFSGPIEYPFKFPHEDSNNSWQRIVAHYSRLQLTYASDRLPAIAAIVERTMRSQKEYSYIAGMWMSSMLYHAAWYRVNYGKDLERADDTKPT
jgi:hypothetical protein